jgi:glutamate racemase
MSALPIGVFDSGVGGLTVLRAMRARLPRENFLYLGDTARLPYGTKTAQTISRYAIQAAELLVQRGIKCLVVACNTASAVALEELRARLAPLPVLGVIEPGAEAACRVSLTGKMVIVGTEGTVQGGAYPRAIRARRPDAEVMSRACPMFVALAEEGWVQGEIAAAVARRYLHAFFAPPAEHFPSELGGDSKPDTLLLGCTHFPLLLGPIREVIGSEVIIVDSAATTAAALASLLEDTRLQTKSIGPGRFRLMATDGSQRFARVGSLFLEEPILAEHVELVDL